MHLLSTFALSFSILQSSLVHEETSYPKATIALLGGTFLNDAMLDSSHLIGSFKIETSKGMGEWEWSGIKEVYQRMNLICRKIVLAAIPRVAEIGNAPRIMDRLLRTDPGFTYKKKPGKVESRHFPVE